MAYLGTFRLRIQLQSLQLQQGMLVFPQKCRLPYFEHLQHLLLRRHFRLDSCNIRVVHQSHPDMCQSRFRLRKDVFDFLSIGWAVCRTRRMSKSNFRIQNYFSKIIVFLYLSWADENVGILIITISNLTSRPKWPQI